MEAILVPLKDKIMIINRSFWPIYPVLGEALLRLAEELSEAYDVTVVMQDHVGIKGELRKQSRGQNVNFYPVKSWSNSASGIIVRALDSVYFMIAIFLILIKLQPNKLYVSTDPPVLVPFLVMIYCSLFRRRYIYHVQDIHPEATRVVIPLNAIIFKILQVMDRSVVKNAHKVVTINAEMAKELRNRGPTRGPIHTIDNPAVSFDLVHMRRNKIKGFSFCGNAGRLQRMPLLIEAIEIYLCGGGKLKFAFAGSGVHQNEIQRLAEEYENVEFFGLITASEAAQLNADYQWAILPIEDEVTRYAFPSKASSYAVAGSLILAVCSDFTSVAKWVKDNCLGLVVEPKVEKLVEVFGNIELGKFDAESFDLNRDNLIKRLDFEVFVPALKAFVID